MTTLTNWVNGGGKLIAMRPDKQLAGLLGLASASGSAEQRLPQGRHELPGLESGSPTRRCSTTAAPTATSSTGATAVATLYSNATTATPNPAVTLRSVGSAGGQAAAFTYDLARSVVYTRQGNPAWAGQERDGVSGIRPDDMFYSHLAQHEQDRDPAGRRAAAAAGQPDHPDGAQQDAAAALLVPAARARRPSVVMSGDDHSPGNAPGGTASTSTASSKLSPPGCVVANWECVRSTSYVYPDSVLTNAQAAAYTADGFEVALHPVVASCPTDAIARRRS